jgi:hypothetical protein
VKRPAIEPYLPFHNSCQFFLSFQKACLPHELFGHSINLKYFPTHVRIILQLPPWIIQRGSPGSPSFLLTKVASCRPRSDQVTSKAYSPQFDMPSIVLPLKCKEFRQRCIIEAFSKTCLKFDLRHLLCHTVVGFRGPL